MTQREEALRYLKRTAVAVSVDRVLREPITRLDDVSERVQRAMDQVIQNRENFTRELAARWIANRPSAVMKRKEERLRGLGERQVRALSGGLEKKESSLVRLQSLLKALGPESAFERGFSIMMDEDGKVVKDADTVKKGQRLETIMKGGVVTSVAD